MDPENRRRIRTRAVGFATAGLLGAMGVGLVLKVLGLTRISFREWAVALGVTLAAQGVVWLIAARGWDSRLTFDPHYLIVPMLAVALVLDTYIYLAPDSRHRVLMVWFVALLFMAGRAGFREVVILSGVMGAGYVAATGAAAPRSGAELPAELALAAVFLLTNAYAGLVFERLRHEHREMRLLRLRFAELARTDALTGIANRRGFEDALRTELARVTRYGGRCCVAMIDVDHFKNYNDHRGHPEGDALLRQLADVIRSGLRAGDLAARYGGEEFAVVMINTALADGAEVVERLRRAVEETAFPHREIQPGARLTVSAGVAEFPGDGDNDEAVVLAADSALYRAKAAGRNRVLLAARLPTMAKA
jgi:diguanylate cyclase (GGDEF)-like protein